MTTRSRLRKPKVITITLALSALLGLTLSLNGCAPARENVRTDITIQQAKAETIQVLREIAAYVPENAMLKTEAPLSNRRLLDCGPTDSQAGYWPGSITHTVASTTDVRAIARSIETDWGKRTGWATHVSENTATFLTIELRAPDGSLYIVSAVTSARTDPYLRVAGFSSCIYVEGLTPYDRF